MIVTIFNIILRMIQVGKFTKVFWKKIIDFNKLDRFCSKSLNKLLFFEITIMWFSYPTKTT